MPNTSTSEPMARVLSLVHGAKQTSNGWAAPCPAHDDRNPSLSIAQGVNGCVLLKCHAGCETLAIVAALGLRESDLFKPTGRTRSVPRPKPTRPVRSFVTANEVAEYHAKKSGPWDVWWTYSDLAGTPVGLVLRWGIGKDKTYRQAWQLGGRWFLESPGDAPPRPLYALDRIAKNPKARVYVAEGEKCADILANLGLLSTTSSGGKSAAAKSDWLPLAGREVVILPDAGTSHQEYASTIGAILTKLDPPAQVTVIILPDLGDGEDVEQFIERNHKGDADAARTAITELAATALATSVRRRPQITFAELLKDPKLRTKPETIASGWEPFDRAQPFEAIERGTKLVLAAPPGCYKTATMLRLARGFAEQGHRVAWMAAEMQPSALLRRMLCQMARLDQSAIFSACPDHVRKFADATHRLQGFAHLIECQRAPIGFEELERAVGVAEVVFVDYLQLVRHPQHDVRGHEKLEEVMGQIAELSQRDGAVFIIASAQGREGGGEKRGIHNATRGSSSIEFTVDALYCASKPEPTSNGTVVVFDCFKQREGAALPIEVPIDHHTGAIAEVEYE